jgi:predicted 2-oxoglutarate/Fe(II)-dependent dioxygenase YbiX/peroxiredoxin
MYQRGDFVPWFIVGDTAGQNFVLERWGGRYVALCFFESSAFPFSRRVLADIERSQAHFNGDKTAFVGISSDSKDASLRYMWEAATIICDPSGQLGRLYQRVPNTDGSRPQPLTIILDPMLRVAAVLPFDGAAEEYVPKLIEYLDRLPPIESRIGHAPVIILPDVFEPEFCRMLIGLYEQHGGRVSGGLEDAGGKTARVRDQRFKSRSDYQIEDRGVQEAALMRLRYRLVPEIHRAFQFQPDAVDRHIVACYEATAGGHFNPHRDNTTELTAFRRFAVTMNLNAEEYEGGDLCFPEYGTRLYRCPTGGAVVFSCTLRHEAKLVTKGRRFAYLPFLYDKEGFEKYVALYKRMYPEAHAGPT